MSVSPRVARAVLAASGPGAGCSCGGVSDPDSALGHHPGCKVLAASGPEYDPLTDHTTDEYKAAIAQEPGHVRRPAAGPGRGTET